MWEINFMRVDHMGIDLTSVDVVGGPHIYIFAYGEMAGVCLECWLNLCFLVQPSLLHFPADSTFWKLYESTVLLM